MQKTKEISDKLHCKVTLLGIILLLISNLFCYSQKEILIFGRVTDNAEEALPFVTVYLNNTSFFTITDTLGNYRMAVPDNLQKMELVASFVGFKPGKVLLSNDGKNKKVIFRLESRTELQEIKVSAKMDRYWKKKWKLFEEGLLGQSPFARKCEILNQGVVKLDYDEKTKKVTAFTREPLLIENKALGYKIQVEVDFFESDGQLSYMAANKFFDSLEVTMVKDLRNIFRNRRRAYENSFRSFLISLIQENSGDKGFYVFQMKEIRDYYLGKVALDDSSNHFFKKIPLRKLIKYDSLEHVYSLNSSLPLLVLNKNLYNRRSPFSDYPYQFSQIEIPMGYFTFNKNGWIVNPNSLLIHNYWGQEGIADLLPDNYEIIEKVDFLLKTDVDSIDLLKHKDKSPVLPEKIILK